MKKLGFGCMRLPCYGPLKINMKEVKEMVDMFLSRGFTYFDTAYMYHAFQSEGAVRKALVERYPRDKFTLTTKMPTMFLRKESDLETIFSRQLKKCGVDFFDFYLLHNLGEENYKTAQKFDAFGFVQRKKEEGVIKKSGFSFHDNAELLDVILNEHPEIDVVQLQLNYIDWDNEGIQSRKCYEVARKHGKEIIVMEPVKGGTLANVPPKAQELMTAYNDTASPASWAIRFAASHDGILTVLSGMSSLQQMDDNTTFMQDFVPINAEEQTILDKTVAIINESVAVPCTACGYCVAGCPKRIPISKYFALLNAQTQSLNRMFSTQQTYYDNLIKTNGKASDCVGCRQCEKACPQHIEITKFLKDVSKTFGK